MKKIKEKLIEFLNWLLKIQGKFTPRVDKLGHFYWGALYAFLVDLVTDNIFIILVPLLFAISKEVRDRMKDDYGVKLGNFEWADIFWTSLPGLLFFYS